MSSSILFEAFGDFVRVGIADVGDTYQRILLQHSALAPPPSLPGDMVTVHDPVPEGPMSDWQLKWLSLRQPGYPDTEPTISAPQTASNFSPPAAMQSAVAGVPSINDAYGRTEPMVGLPPPEPDEPDMDF